MPQIKEINGILTEYYIYFTIIGISNNPLYRIVKVEISYINFDIKTGHIIETN